MPADGIGQGTWPGFLGLLDRREVRGLRAISRPRTYPAHSVLLHQGDDSDHVVILGDGWAAVTMATGSGHSVMLGLAGQNDILGEEAAIHGRVRAATVTALTKVTAYLVPAARFQGFLQAHPRVWEALHRVMVQHREASDIRAHSHALADGTQRLALLLVQLAERAGIQSDHGSILVEVPLTQAQLGSWVDVSRLTVTRCLSRWRKDGLVRTGPRKIHVLDLGALRALTGTSLPAPGPWQPTALPAEVSAPPDQRIAAHAGPTMVRILLGARLRQIREDRGISREDAGYEIRLSDSKMSRLERGRLTASESDVAALLALYGVKDKAERSVLLDLAGRANKPAWWHDYNDVIPSWFEVFIGLEDAADLIRTFEMQFVPGLLQTSDYARAVITSLGHPHGVSAHEVDRKVTLRMTRQRILHRSDMRYWAVIDEATLRRPFGGEQVMRQQIHALIEACAQPNITIQVLPFRRAGLESGSFHLLRFAEQDLPDIVYLEQLSSAIYLDQQRDVDLYTNEMDRLCATAAKPTQTLEMLHDILREL